MSKYFFTFFIIFLSLNTILTSNETFRSNIRGYVRDADSGEALPYANISVDGTNRGTTTNADGYFILVNEPVGKVQLMVRYIGYEGQLVHIENKVGLEPLDIRLKLVVLEVDGINVTANAEMMSTNTEISQIRLSPRQLSTLPSIGETDISC